MVADRRLTRWLNGVCAALALGAVATIGMIALSRNRAEKAILIPKAVTNLRAIKRSAYEAERRGDFKEAERWYREALRQNSPSPSIEQGLAQALVVQGKRREAWEIYRRSLAPCLQQRQSPAGGTGALAWYADLAVQFGDRENALKALRLIYRGQRPAPTLSESLMAQAHVAGAQSGTSAGPVDAQGHLQRALELDPSSILARIELANQLFSDSKRPEAEARLAEAAKLIKPGDVFPWIQIAEAYHRQGRSSDVRATLDRAMRQIPRDRVDAWLHFSWSAGYLGADSQARAAVEIVRRTVDPHDKETLSELAQHYLSLGDHPQARKMIEMALRTATPQDALVYGRLAGVLIALGDKKEGESILRKALPYAKGNDRLYLQALLPRPPGGPHGFGGGPRAFPGPVPGGMMPIYPGMPSHGMLNPGMAGKPGASPHGAVLPSASDALP